MMLQATAHMEAKDDSQANHHIFFKYNCLVKHFAQKPQSNYFI